MTKQGHWLGGLIVGLLLAFVTFAADASAFPAGALAAPQSSPEWKRGAAPPRLQAATDLERRPRSAAAPRRALIDPRKYPRLDKRAQDREHALIRRITYFKLGVAVATLGLLVAGQHLAGRGRGTDWLRTRRAVLLLLAVAGFASSYNFFRWLHYDGIHAHEVFHYYLGSKYFAELGYFDLYECAVVALAQEKPKLAHRVHVIRDLHNITQRKSIVPAESGHRCEEAFTPARWRQFKQDVMWMKARLPKRYWNGVFLDQGFNASPVWTLFGRPLAWAFPADDASIRAAVRIDLLLLGAAFAAVAWSFGLQVFCLAVIAWSINPLAGYEWVGDAFLRQLWFSTAMVGLCLLARQRHAAAGVLLGVSAAARVFPLFYAIGYALGRVREFAATRRIDRGFVRFAATGAVATALLIGAAVWVCGRGPGVLVEFARNITAYSELKAANSVGLRPLLTYTSRRPVPYLVNGKLVSQHGDREALNRRTFESRRGLWYAGVAIGLLLFWRALRHAKDWEAAVLGFVLILLFTQAACYYMTCTVPIALLATGRPRIAVGLMAALAAWCIVKLACEPFPIRFTWASVVALLLALFVLWEMRAPALPGVPAAPAGIGGRPPLAVELRGLPPGDEATHSWCSLLRWI